MNNMLAGEIDPEKMAETVVEYLSDHKSTATHARHLPISKCEELKLKVVKLEDDQTLQDLVLTVHHAFIHTFSLTPAIKIVENHLGVANVLMGVIGQPPSPQGVVPTMPDWKPPSKQGLPMLPSPEIIEPTAPQVDPAE